MEKNNKTTLRQDGFIDLQMIALVAIFILALPIIIEWIGFPDIPPVVLQYLTSLLQLMYTFDVAIPVTYIISIATFIIVFETGILALKFAFMVFGLFTGGSTNPLSQSDKK